MAEITNRAAENGSIIINDTNPHVFTSGKLPAIVRILADTTINTITSDSTTGISWYNAKALTPDDPSILASITSIQLTSGTVQVIFT
jgi:hypothetical protein